MKEGKPMASVASNQQNREIFAYNLKQLMAQNNLPPAALNQRLTAQYGWKKAPGTINIYAKGTQMPSQKRRQQMAAVLGVTEKYMLTDHRKTATPRAGQKRVPLCREPANLNTLLQRAAAAEVTKETLTDDLRLALISDILSLPAERLGMMARIAELPNNDVPLINWFLDEMERFQ